ncbi:polysaccharide lyase family 8 super-sandwich domain-containing protein [Paraferrimonas sp. SM1919]|uniref:polysaccharide lyase family 8 super-sandwich domain-containing protein n=1 Tax=Paraferrimonas sp. SM1919 TaxID=2662263 RepID=UPI0013CF4F6D|nr:polysaccharide lyase family 8 super-sandwich domain-containing protein [Paraferrimonas sp. SM1919]
MKYPLGYQLLACAMSIGVYSDGVRANVDFTPSYSFLGQMQSQQTQFKATPLLAGYFDIEVGAQKGQVVYGRINLDDNRHYLSQNNGNLYQLSLATKNAGLELINVIDDKGRLFGELRVVDENKFANQDKINVEVELYKQGKKLYSTNIEINVVAQTAWTLFSRKFDDYIDYHARLNARYKPKNEKKLAQVIKQIVNNQGKLDFPFYNQTHQQQLASGKKSMGNQLAKASETIAGLAYAYSHNPDYQNPLKAKQLREIIYSAAVTYLDHFPSRNFNKTKLIGHGDISHQWRFSDPLLGAMSVIHEDFFADIDQGEVLALKLHQSLLEFMQEVNFTLPLGYLDPQYKRYYMPQSKMLSYSNGAWSDANRHHRQRSWMAQTLLSRDYNRPLTYLPYWYEGYQTWGENNTQVLPKWRPNGSFFDMKTWLDSNTQLSHRYGQSGLLPDGSISHHIGLRQDMAHVAYGFEWIGNGITKAAQLLADTPFAVEAKALEEQRSFLLFTYPKIMYKGGLDFQTAGRSHYSKNLNNFAAEVFVPTIAKNLSLNSHRELAYTQELKALKSQLEQGKESFYGSYAMWANDFLIHRNLVDESPFYMSVKMQSDRTKGAEGFAKTSQYGFHNGSGVLQVKTHGNEYNESRFAMDWHALPGITEEWRTDPIPLSSKYKKYNPNAYAGTLVGDNAAMAAFHYDREDPYASARADKAWLFNKNYVWSLGKGINRTKQGQGQPIVTTVDQALWVSDINYFQDQQYHTIKHGQSVQNIISTDSPLWLHQGNVGYIIFPQEQLNLFLTTANKINRSDRSNHKAMPVFHLAIDHSINPRDAKYHYVTIANATAEQMPEIYEQLRNIEIVNQQQIQAHYQKDKLLQVVFHGPGQVQFKDGTSISSDQSALVQLKKSKGDWQLSVADPLHSKALEKITINTTVKLQPGSYTYSTQGVDNKELLNQLVKVELKQGLSNIEVNLPSQLDQSNYNHRVDFYTGMPATVNF